tara:strand:- start:317 stop:1141 length:825 start_codon:yes stop_codon:yes gene_type:complete
MIFKFVKISILLFIFITGISKVTHADTKDFNFFKNTLLFLDSYPDFISSSNILYGQYTIDDNEIFYVGYCAARSQGDVIIFSIENEKPKIHDRDMGCLNRFSLTDYNFDKVPELFYQTSGGGSGLGVKWNNLLFYNNKDNKFEIFKYESSRYEHRGPRLELPIQLNPYLIEELKNRAEKNTWDDHGIYSIFSQNSKVTFEKNTFPSDKKYKKEITTYYEFEYVHGGDINEEKEIKKLAEEILNFIVQNSNFKLTECRYGKCDTDSAIQEIKIIN